ncbi:RNA-binding protein [Candidatus Woesearchaeota archaeon]|nr:RNA-binding protein [Candidatus Woesearchaeota archaeon]
MKKRLNKSEILNLNYELKQQFGISDLFSKKDAVYSVKNKHTILYLNDQPVFFIYEKKWAPALKLLLQKQVIKTIIVDMGAVKFIADGADVMRPGIVEISGNIKQNDFVVIVDIMHKKPLAVGIALFDSEAMKNMQSGKVVKNIHHVGDELWNA